VTLSRRRAKPVARPPWPAPTMRDVESGRAFAGLGFEPGEARVRDKIQVAADAASRAGRSVGGMGLTVIARSGATKQSRAHWIEIASSLRSSQ